MLLETSRVNESLNCIVVKRKRWGYSRLYAVDDDADPFY